MSEAKPLTVEEAVTRLKVLAWQWDHSDDHEMERSVRAEKARAVLRRLAGGAEDAKPLTVAAAVREIVPEPDGSANSHGVFQERERVKAILLRLVAGADAEIAELRAYKAEIENATKAALDEDCAAGEKHCACVPLLRAEVKRLKEKLGEEKEGTDGERN